MQAVDLFRRRTEDVDVAVRPGRDVELKLDVFPQRAPQQRLHVLNERIAIDRRGLQHLTAGKGEQALGQGRGAVGAGRSPDQRGGGVD